MLRARRIVKHYSSCGENRGEKETPGRGVLGSDQVSGGGLRYRGLDMGEFAPRLGRRPLKSPSACDL